MSKSYNASHMDKVKDFGAGALSGDMFSMGDTLQKAKSNVSFRISSGRELIMGIRGSTSMTPMERRSEIRRRRLELLGVRSEGGNKATRTSPSPSGQIGERSSSSAGTSRSTSSPSSPSGSPLMSEVDKGTKARASERGFGT